METMIFTMGKKILGIVGSYRKGGIVDSLVSEVLAAAQEQGAQTEKIYLLDEHIFAYWPWNSHKGPVMRTQARDKKAVLVTATAMPAILGRYFTGAVRALKLTAQTLGARPVATVFIGMIAQQQKETLPDGARQKARQAGRKLAASLHGG